MTAYKVVWHCRYQHYCSRVDVFDTTKNRKHFPTDKDMRTGLMLSYLLLSLDSWTVNPLKSTC